jgi:hypothetical protein
MTEGRQRYWNQVRELQMRLGISHMEARNRWNRYYERGGKPKRAIKKLVLSVQASRADATTCPFCRDSIFHPEEGGGPDYICGSCRAHYHLDCFEDELGGRCATLGCSTRRVISQARVRIRARGRGARPLTPETPVTTARANGPTAQELDPRTYQTSQDLAQAAPQEPVQTPEEAERGREADRATRRVQARRDALEDILLGAGQGWDRFVESCREQGPALLLTGLVIGLTLFLCWLYVLVVTG